MIQLLPFIVAVIRGEGEEESNLRRVYHREAMHFNLFNALGLQKTIGW